MTTSFSNQIVEVPFLNEVAFEYNKELFKVHVNVLTEKDEAIYKLYFKNNIKNTDKSIMKLVKETGPDGNIAWVCRSDYFSYYDNEIAAIVGKAIDRVLKEHIITH